MKTFTVAQYYRVELEVQADSYEDARAAAYEDANLYTVTATFDDASRQGGPNVEAADIDTEVWEVSSND